MSAPTAWRVPSSPGLEVWALAGGEPRELLRDRVAARHGITPGSVSFIRRPCPACAGSHGRPAVQIPAGAPEISLARSDSLSLAVLAAGPVGIDLEPVPDLATANDVAELLHPADRRWFSAQPEDARPLALARLWTRTEAYLKAVGTGIAAGLGAVSLAGGAPAGWRVSELHVGAGHAAAVVWRCSAAAARRHQPR